MKPTTLKCIIVGNSKKGNELGIARIASIMAEKKTADLIPLYHPLVLTRVEKEALNTTQVALLTIYDMCNALDKGMIIDGVRLL